MLHAASFDASTLSKKKRVIAGKYLLAYGNMVVKEPGHSLFSDATTLAKTVYVGIADQLDLNILYTLNGYVFWDVKRIASR